MAFLIINLKSNTPYYLAVSYILYKDIKPTIHINILKPCYSLLTL